MSNESTTPALLIKATYHLHAEDIDAYKQIAAQVRQKSRESAGCLSFDVAQDLADPTLFYLIEGWTNQEALAAHSDSAEFKALLQQALALRILDRSMLLYHVSGVERPPMPS